MLVVLAGIVYLGNFLEEGTNTWFEVRRFDKATDEGGKGEGQHCVYILFLRNVLQRTIIEQLEWSERVLSFTVTVLIFFEWQCKWNIFSFFLPRRHIKHGELAQIDEMKNETNSNDFLVSQRGSIPGLSNLNF